MKGSADVPAVSSLALRVELLDMEPRVMSMVWVWWVREPDAAGAEEADKVLPRASVVVRSHCFASTVLGRMGGLVGLVP